MEIEGEDNEGWEEMPWVPLITILSYLEVKDIGRVAAVSQAWAEASKSNQIWRPLCARDLLIFSPDDDSNNSYKLTYQRIMEHWGDTLAYYKPCKRLSQRINQFIIDNSLKAELNPPASPLHFDALLSLLSLSPLPRDFVCFYKFHNGQKVGVKEGGMYGNYSFYNWWVSMEMTPLQQLSAFYSQFQNEIFAEGWLKDFFPISISKQTNKLFLIRHRLSPDNPIDQEGKEKIEVGGVVTHYSNFVWPFKIADSFMEYMERYWERVEGGVFELSEKQRNIVLFPQQTPLFSIPHAVTRSIHVAVSTLFIPELSHPEKRYHWAYSIKMWMEDEVPADHRGKFQLKNRKWHLINGNGVESTVEGPGVIGLYPVLSPGSSFSYESCYIEPTPSGSMRGHFEFQNVESMEVFPVEIPLFTFSLPTNDIIAPQMNNNENANIIE